MKTAEKPAPVTETATPAQRGQKPAAHPGRQLRLLGYVVLWCIASYLFITHFVLMAVEIRGASMSPTLRDGERYVLYRCTYLVRQPRKGEIVVIKDPEDNGLSVKRIVALPNDVIEFRNDGFYVNNEKTPEPYLLSKYKLAPRYQPTRPVRLEKGEYFLLGDNRNRSADSRSYGPVSRNAILGVLAK